MKNKFLLFPLIAALLTCSACSSSKGGKKKGGNTDTSITEDFPEEDDTSEAIVHYAETVAKGENHALPWTLSYDNFEDPTGALGYGAYNKTYNFASTNVYAYGMRAVQEISVNIGGRLVTYKKFKIIHFCKFKHDNWPDGGQFQISDVKASKLVLELVSYGNYSYNPSSTISVFSGGRRIETPKEAIISTSAVNEEFQVQTLTFDVNATEPEMVKIANANRFSMYIQSIRFE